MSGGEPLDWPGEPPLSVIQRCRAKYGYPTEQRNACVVIYAKDMLTIVGTEDCRDWCPLLNERIE